jgi:hypothetical protein
MSKLFSLVIIKNMTLKNRGDDKLLPREYKNRI